MNEFFVRPRNKSGEIILFAVQNIVRESLLALFDGESEFNVVGRTGEADSLLKLLNEKQPAVVFLYLTQNDTDAVELISEIQRFKFQTQVLVLVSQSDIDNQKRAFQLGAAGIVYHENDVATLFQALRRVANGDSWLDQKLARQLLTSKQNNSAKEHSITDDSFKISTLTDREREVVGMVGSGFKNQEIAERLNISKATVRHHLSSVYNKLEIKDKLNLVIYAHRHKLVKPVSSQFYENV
jgi:DNA-binding NarL/FixJ family response regulator